MKEIAILDNKNGQIHLKGLSQVPINSMVEFQEMFSYAIQRRKVAHTKLNDVSSRIHGVHMIAILSFWDVDNSRALVVGKLNFIDLADNEDNKRTCNDRICL
ncbi:hypothetical protein QYF36_001663 [Acer negundo]|nr:hypothetical protein QYF36_001663 [Acer negundo]